jgi:hypothetical protein
MKGRGKRTEDRRTSAGGVAPDDKRDGTGAIFGHGTGLVICAMYFISVCAIYITILNYFVFEMSVLIAHPAIKYIWMG